MPETDAGIEEDWSAVLSRQIALHGRLLFRIAQGIVRNTSAAEDVVQDALLKAWQRQDAIRNPAAVKQWLVRSVVNGALAVVRRRKVEGRVLQKQGVASVGDRIPEIEQTEMRESLLSALETLPESTREIVVLRVLHGFSGNEVKDLLGCSATEVSRHLHRGLELLRGVLSGSCISK